MKSLAFAPPLLAACLLTLPTPARGIPAFARRYRTGCTTCHTAPPKLNVLGEAFRLNGYRMPENERLLRREEVLPLGDEAWRELWPRAVWPGEIPAAIPLSLRIQLDGYVTRHNGVRPASNFEFPHELYFLAGTTLGEGISVFLEATWSPTDNPAIVQAKVALLHPLKFLPRRAFDLWIGLQDIHPFTLAARQTDRAGRQLFSWQTYSPSNITLSGTPGQIRPLNEHAVIRPQPTIMAQGLITPQIAYTAGIAQGGQGSVDNNNHKDAFATLRWKLGGLRLDGTYRSGEGPIAGSRGQLYDHALVLEQFAYWGAEPAPGGGDASWRALGFAARVLWGPLDLGAGVVARVDHQVFGSALPGDLRQRSVFAKAEYAVLPWLFGSLKAEWFAVDVADTLRALGYTSGRFGQTRIMPGVYAMVRQNVRAVVEADLHPRREADAAQVGGRPASRLWFRLDLAF